MKAQRSKAKVHRLFPAIGPVVKPDTNLIAVCAELLAHAKRGEIKGLGYFIVDGANATETSWVSAGACANLMVAGAAQLAYRIMKTDHDGKGA